MRNRTWSDVVIALTIGLCVAIVAEPQARQSGTPGTAIGKSDLSEASRSLAIAVLFDSRRTDIQNTRIESSRAQAQSTPSVADRAMTNAAEAAGNVARGIEMPFFSFGGDASAE